MRRILLAVAVLLVAAPAASAHSFELPEGSGDLVIRAASQGEASLMIAHVGRGARIFAPADVQGIGCVKKGQPIHRCASLKRGARVNEWQVLRPVKLWHQQAGAFQITIRKASRLRAAVFMGAGTVSLRGTGEYLADGAEAVSYAPADQTVSVTLQP